MSGLGPDLLPLRDADNPRRILALGGGGFTGQDGRFATAPAASGAVCCAKAAAETLREARRAASRHDEDRLRRTAGHYAALASCGFADAAAVMLRGRARRGEQQQPSAAAPSVRARGRRGALDERAARQGGPAKGEKARSAPAEEPAQGMAVAA